MRDRRPADPHREFPGPGPGEPARLVGRTFRCTMRAAMIGEPASLVLAWQEFANAAGGGHADELVRGMSHFASAVHGTAQRRIELLPPGCPGFCRDECLAISIIAAAQHAACPAMKACIFALIASSRTEQAMDAAGAFATALRTAGQELSGAAMCNAAALAPIDPALRAS